MHLDDRISMEPGTPRRGQTATIEYRGLLKESGADGVWIHCGYDGWKNVSAFAMQRTPSGNFTCSLEVQGTQEMNFCFKDSANNWDNNNGMNWKATIG